MVAYLIAQGGVHDPELLARYAAEGGGSTIIQHGGTILAADAGPLTLGSGVTQLMRAEYI